MFHGVLDLSRKGRGPGRGGAAAGPGPDPGGFIKVWFLLQRGINFQQIRVPGSETGSGRSFGCIFEHFGGPLGFI